MVLKAVLKKLVGKRVALASGSPRRQEILNNAGLQFEVVPSWFKETLEKSTFSAPYKYAVETAKQKALEVANRMHVKHLQTPDIVIGADTIVPVLSEEEGSEHEGEELAGPPSPGPSSLAMPQVFPEGEEVGQEPDISEQSDSDGDKSWLDPRQRRRDKRTQQKRRRARD